MDKKIIEYLMKINETVHFRMFSTDECRIIYETAKKIKAKNLVELGVGNGTSTIMLLLWCKEIGGTLTSIDTEEGTGMSYSRAYKSPLFYIKYLGLEKYWNFIRGDSVLVGKEWKNPIDLLLIDSSHYFEQTILELLYYSPFITDTGSIFLHDVLHPGHSEDLNSAAIGFILNNRKCLDKTQARKKQLTWHYEIINTWNGLGRLYKGMGESGGIWDITDILIKRD